MKIPKLILLELEFETIREITNLPFYHGAHWSALFRELLKRYKFSVQTFNLWIHPIETGISEYKENEKIKLGLTFPIENSEMVSQILDRFNSFNLNSGHFSPSFTIKLSNVSCRISGQTWRPDLRIYLSDKIIDFEASLLRELKSFTLLFYSPLRVKRPSGYKSEGHTYCDQDFFCFENQSIVLQHLFSKIRLIGQKVKVKDLFLENANFIWIDVPYGTLLSKTLGGVVGALSLSGSISQKLARIIVAGQYLGIGKNPSFGFGFYMIPELESQKKVKPLSRGGSFYERLEEKPEQMDLINDNQKFKDIVEILSDSLASLEPPSTINSNLNSLIESGYNYSIALEKNHLYHIIETKTFSNLLRALFPFENSVKMITNSLFQVLDFWKTQPEFHTLLFTLFEKMLISKFIINDEVDSFLVIYRGNPFLLLNSCDREVFFEPLKQFLSERKLTIRVLNSENIESLKIEPNLPFRLIGQIHEEIEQKNETETETSGKWAKLFKPEEDFGISVYITSQTVEVYSEGPYLVLKSSKDHLEKIFWNQIGRIFIIGNSNYNHSLINRALKECIPVAFLDIMGKAKGFLYPEDFVQDDFSKLQKEFSDNFEFCLTFAKEIISAKIHNSSVILRRNSVDNSGLREVLKKISSVKDLDSLRGYEGIASRIYFEGLSQLFKPFEFKGRVYHPPDGPINIMLSLGYSLLYYRIASVLKFKGLNPRIGYYHRGRGSHFSLAFDLLEELRHIAERVTLSLIHLGILKKSNFKQESNNRISLSYEGFVKYLNRFEKTMARSNIYYSDKPMSYNSYLEKMADNFINTLRFNVPYRALRID